MRFWNIRIRHLLRDHPNQQYRTREIVELTCRSFTTVRANLNAMLADGVVSKTPTTGEGGKPAFLWQWAVEDESAFGADAWVYCNQHMRPHQTGWCGVSPRDKVGLGVTTAEAALEKCRAWGFALYADQQ